MDTKLALRPEQAANALGISRSKLYELLHAGKLPSVRLGGVRVIPVEALRKLIAAVAQTHPAPSTFRRCSGAGRRKGEEL